MVRGMCDASVCVCLHVFVCMFVCVLFAAWPS